MRIGVDGRWVFRGNPSGRVVVRHLLQQLTCDHPEHEYFIFLPRRDRGRVFPFSGPRVQLLYLRGRNGLLSNCIFLPWKARDLGLDVCLTFYFAPWSGSFKKIVWINDIIFLEFPQFFTWKERLYFLPMRRLGRRANRICVLSQSEKERMVRWNFAPAEKIVPVPLGVDGTYVPAEAHDAQVLRAIRERYGLPDRFLLYVGRMNERKNILNLLKAVQELDDRRIPLVLAGDPDWRMFDLPRAIRDLRLSQRVLLLGRVPDEDLPGVFALARVFCYVSFAEGFGLPPLEAMASGVPIVVSDRDSLPEVCAGAGTYADPAKPAAIAAAIDSLLCDPGLWERKRAQGLERARSFAWGRSAEVFLGICRELKGDSL